MGFSLSSRSLGKLEGVHPDMVAVVKRAIELTDVDFGVTYGVRTLAEQEEEQNFGFVVSLPQFKQFIIESPSVCLYANIYHFRFLRAHSNIMEIT